MTKDPRPRRCRPSLEGLEVRDLLSASAVHAASARHEATPSLNLMVATRNGRLCGHQPRRACPNAIAGKSTGTPAWVNESFPAIAGQPALWARDDDDTDHRR